MKRLEFNGKTYIGEIDAEGRPRGVGMVVDGESTKFGNFDGSIEVIPPGLLQQSSGDFVIFGESVGIFYFAGSGDRYEGEIQAGTLLRTGFGVYTWENGSTYSGQFNKGTALGLGIQQLFRRRTYLGEFDHDLPNGHGCQFVGEGSYQGQFVRGKRCGYGAYTDGKIENKGEWKDDELVSIGDFDGKVHRAINTAMAAMEQASAQVTGSLRSVLAETERVRARVTKLCSRVKRIRMAISKELKIPEFQLAGAGFDYAVASSTLSLSLQARKLAERTVQHSPDCSPLSGDITLPRTSDLFLGIRDGGDHRRTSAENNSISTTPSVDNVTLSARQRLSHLLDARLSGETPLHTEGGFNQDRYDVDRVSNIYDNVDSVLFGKERDNNGGGVHEHEIFDAEEKGSGRAPSRGETFGEPTEGDIFQFASGVSVPSPLSNVIKSRFGLRRASLTTSSEVSEDDIRVQNDVIDPLKVKESRGKPSDQEASLVPSRTLHTTVTTPRGQVQDGELQGNIRQSIGGDNPVVRSIARGDNDYDGSSRVGQTRDSNEVPHNGPYFGELAVPMDRARFTQRRPNSHNDLVHEQRPLLPPSSTWNNQTQEFFDFNQAQAGSRGYEQERMMVQLGHPIGLGEQSENPNFNSGVLIPGFTNPAYRMSHLQRSTHAFQESTDSEKSIPQAATSEPYTALQSMQQSTSGQYNPSGSLQSVLLNGLASIILEPRDVVDIPGINRTRQNEKASYIVGSFDDIGGSTSVLYSRSAPPRSVYVPLDLDHTFESRKAVDVIEGNTSSLSTNLTGHRGSIRSPLNDGYGNVRNDAHHVPSASFTPLGAEEVSIDSQLQINALPYVHEAGVQESIIRRSRQQTRSLGSDALSESFQKTKPVDVPFVMLNRRTCEDTTFTEVSRRGGRVPREEDTWEGHDTDDKRTASSYHLGAGRLREAVEGERQTIDSAESLAEQTYERGIGTNQRSLWKHEQSSIENEGPFIELLGHREKRRLLYSENQDSDDSQAASIKRSGPGEVANRGLRSHRKEAPLTSNDAASFETLTNDDQGGINHGLHQETGADPGSILILNHRQQKSANSHLFHEMKTGKADDEVAFRELRRRHEGVAHRPAEFNDNPGSLWIGRSFANLPNEYLSIAEETPSDFTDSNNDRKAFTELVRHRGRDINRVRLMNENQDKTARDHGIFTSLNRPRAEYVEDDPLSPNEQNSLQNEESFVGLIRQGKRGILSIDEDRQSLKDEAAGLQLHRRREAHIGGGGLLPTEQPRSAAETVGTLTKITGKREERVFGKGFSYDVNQVGMLSAARHPSQRIHHVGRADLQGDPRAIDEGEVSFGALAQESVERRDGPSIAGEDMYDAGDYENRPGPLITLAHDRTRPFGRSPSHEFTKTSGDRSSFAELTLAHMHNKGSVRENGDLDRGSLIELNLHRREGISQNTRTDAFGEVREGGVDAYDEPKHRYAENDVGHNFSHLLEEEQAGAGSQSFSELRREIGTIRVPPAMHREVGEQRDFFAYDGKVPPRHGTYGAPEQLMDGHEELFVRISRRPEEYTTQSETSGMARIFQIGLPREGKMRNVTGFVSSDDGGNVVGIITRSQPSHEDASDAETFSFDKDSSRDADGAGHNFIELHRHGAAALEGEEATVPKAYVQLVAERAFRAEEITHDALPVGNLGFGGNETSPAGTLRIARASDTEGAPVLRYKTDNEEAGDRKGGFVGLRVHADGRSGKDKMPDDGHEGNNGSKNPKSLTSIALSHGRSGFDVPVYYNRERAFEVGSFTQLTRWNASRGLVSTQNQEHPEAFSPLDLGQDRHLLPRNNRDFDGAKGSFTELTRRRGSGMKQNWVQAGHQASHNDSTTNRYLGRPINDALLQDHDQSIAGADDVHLAGRASQGRRVDHDRIPVDNQGTFCDADAEPGIRNHSNQIVLRSPSKDEHSLVPKKISFVKLSLHDESLGRTLRLGDSPDRAGHEADVAASFSKRNRIGMRVHGHDGHLTSEEQSAIVNGEVFHELHSQADWSSAHDPMSGTQQSPLGDEEGFLLRGSHHISRALDKDEDEDSRGAIPSASGTILKPSRHGMPDINEVVAKGDETNDGLVTVMFRIDRGGPAAQGLLLPEDRESAEGDPVLNLSRRIVDYGSRAEDYQTVSRDLTYVDTSRLRGRMHALPAEGGYIGDNMSLNELTSYHEGTQGPSRPGERQVLARLAMHGENSFFQFSRPRNGRGDGRPIDDGFEATDDRLGDFIKLSHHRNVLGTKDPIQRENPENAVKEVGELERVSSTPSVARDRRQTERRHARDVNGSLPLDNGSETVGDASDSGIDAEHFVRNLSNAEEHLETAGLFVKLNRRRGECTDGGNLNDDWYQLDFDQGSFVEADLFRKANAGHGSSARLTQTKTSGDVNSFIELSHYPQAEFGLPLSFDGHTVHLDHDGSFFELHREGRLMQHQKEQESGKSSQPFVPLSAGRDGATTQNESRVVEDGSAGTHHVPGEDRERSDQESFVRLVRVSSTGVTEHHARPRANYEVNDDGTNGNYTMGNLARAGDGQSVPGSFPNDDRGAEDREGGLFGLVRHVSGRSARAALTDSDQRKESSKNWSHSNIILLSRVDHFGKDASVDDTRQSGVDEASFIQLDRHHASRPLLPTEPHERGSHVGDVTQLGRDEAEGAEQNLLRNENQELEGASFFAELTRQATLGVGSLAPNGVQMPVADHKDRSTLLTALHFRGAHSMRDFHEGDEKGATDGETTFDELNMLHPSHADQRFLPEHNENIENIDGSFFLLSRIESQPGRRVPPKHDDVIATGDPSVAGPYANLRRRQVGDSDSVFLTDDERTVHEANIFMNLSRHREGDTDPGALLGETAPVAAVKLQPLTMPNGIAMDRRLPWGMDTHAGDLDEDDQRITGASREAVANVANPSSFSTSPKSSSRFDSMYYLPSATDTGANRAARRRNAAMYFDLKIEESHQNSHMTPPDLSLPNVSAALSLHARHQNATADVAHDVTEDPSIPSRKLWQGHDFEKSVTAHEVLRLSSASASTIFLEQVVDVSDSQPFPSLAPTRSVPLSFARDAPVHSALATFSTAVKARHRENPDDGSLISGNESQRLDRQVENYGLNSKLSKPRLLLKAEDLPIDIRESEDEGYEGTTSFWQLDSYETDDTRSVSSENSTIDRSVSGVSDQSQDRSDDSRMRVASFLARATFEDVRMGLLQSQGRHTEEVDLPVSPIKRPPETKRQAERYFDASQDAQVDVSVKSQHSAGAEAITETTPTFSRPFTVFDVKPSPPLPIVPPFAKPLPPTGSPRPPLRPPYPPPI